MAHAFSTIPARLSSYQTLLHIGFTPNRADQLWHEWENLPATGPQRERLPDENESSSHGSTNDTGRVVSFLDFVLGRILPVKTPHADSRHDDATWIQCLDACGIDSSLKEAIMDPRFRCIRLANSCLLWLLDTVEMQYAGLQDIQCASQQRVAAARVPLDNTIGTSSHGGNNNSARFWNHATATAVGSKPGHLVQYPSEESPAGQILRLDYPSPQWKQVVWRSKTARSLPRPLRKYRDALLLIGTTAKGAQRVFEDMESWEEISSDNVLRVPESNSNPAIQYVFNGEDGSHFLRRKGQFEVFLLSSSDAEAIIMPSE